MVVRVLDQKIRHGTQRIMRREHQLPVAFEHLHYAEHVIRFEAPEDVVDLGDQRGHLLRVRVGDDVEVLHVTDTCQ